MNQASDQKPARARGKLKLILGALLLLGAGAGGAYAALAAGWLGSAARSADAPDHPGLIRKGETDPFAHLLPAAKDPGAAELVDGEGGSPYRTSYFRFEDSFTSNLRGSPALIQVNLAASTRRDARVLQWLAKHQLALRSAVLVELADTTETQATSMNGKAALQKRLTAAINGVLTEAEGFGGVDQVFFEGYLVQ